MPKGRDVRDARRLRRLRRQASDRRSYFATHELGLTQAQDAYQTFKKKQDDRVRVVFRPHGNDQHRADPPRASPRPRPGGVDNPPIATADLTVLALGQPHLSASSYIAEIQRRLSGQERVRYRLHAMGTSLEGATADILALVAELHAVPFEQGAPRVYTLLKLDDGRDRPGQTLDDKIRAVEEKLSSAP